METGRKQIGRNLISLHWIIQITLIDHYFMRNHRIVAMNPYQPLSTPHLCVMHLGGGGDEFAMASELHPTGLRILYISWCFPILASGKRFVGSLVWFLGLPIWGCSFFNSFDKCGFFICPSAVVVSPQNENICIDQYMQRECYFVVAHIYTLYT